MSSAFPFASRLLLLSVGFFVFGQAAQAATVDYSGCFERSDDGSVRTIWMNAPICSIALTDDSVRNTEQFVVKNLDPRLYQVTDQDGTFVQTTAVNNSLSVTVSLPETTALTIAPWDYDPAVSDFWFAAISDNQPEADGGASPNPTFMSLMDQLEPLHVPFLTDAGDLIDGNETDAAAHDAEYVLLTNVFEDYEGSSFVVPGDHDAKNDLDAYYSAYFGERDYTFVYGNTRFIALNDTEDVNNEGLLTEDQLTWLQDTLAAATEAHRIVLMQHPLVAPDWSTAAPLDQDQAAQLAAWFVQYDVKLAIVGNSHGYDDRTITESDFPGMGGSYEQLIVAGAGGTYWGYDGEHFYVLVHVTDSGIEHERIDLPDSDITLSYTTANDGTETSVVASLVNTGAVDIPYMRVPVLLNAEETSSRLYASTPDGQFYEVISTEINSIRYAYVTRDLPVGTNTTLTIQEQRAVVTGVANTIDTDGVITFDALPTSGSATTDLTVNATGQQTSVSVAVWDTDTDEREWSEQTTAYNETAFTVSGLLPNRQYNVYVNDTLRTRVATDESGNFEYAFAGKATTRDYHIQLEKHIVARTIGVGPSANHSPSMRMIDASTGETDDSFYSYDSELQTGISSIWIDSDGDGALELATIPDAGTPGHVRIFRQDGDVIASVFPYGQSFTGGIALAAADVDGDSDQELIVAPKSHHNATVKIYNFSPGSFEKIDSFRVYKKGYHGGVALAVGDMSNDGTDEIVVGALKKKDVIRLYQWNDEDNEMNAFLAVQPFTNEQNRGAGFSLAMGDVNFNGKMDLLVGSYAGNSKVVAYKYKVGTNILEKISSTYAFGRSYSGGVDISAANVNSTENDEVMILGRAGTAEGANMGTFAASTTHMRSLGTINPFGPEYTDGMHLAFIDTDNDYRAEVATSREVGEDRVRVYDKRSGGYAQIDSFSVYASDFSGGLRLTE